MSNSHKNVVAADAHAPATHASTHNAGSTDPMTNPQFTTIELGAASDTTLARVSAGVLSVEGNRLFAVGGTDVPIADGGTGASTAAAAATALGLGTGDSPQHTAIELGHATDTTIARVSAGVISVEGNRLFAVGGTDVPIADGGTGQSTATAAFNALSPMTTSGDIIYGGASGAGTRLAKGSDTQVLTLASGLPSWATPAAASGDVATDTIWDAAGDLAQGTGANTGAKLTAGTAGMMLKSAGAAAANLWAYPPAYEFNYVAITSSVNITATTEAGADTAITAGATAFDGSTIIFIEAFCPWVQVPAGNLSCQWTFYDDTGGGAASIGISARITAEGASNNQRGPVFVRYRVTPSAATHTYSLRAFVTSGTGVVGAGAGGNGNYDPAYIRLVKA